MKHGRGASLPITILALASGLLLAACGEPRDESPAGVAFDTRPPAIPVDVSAVTLPDGHVLVSWRSNRTDPDLTGYVVYRSDTIEAGYRPVVDDPVRSNSFVDELAPALTADDPRSGTGFAPLARVAVRSAATGTPQCTRTRFRSGLHGGNRTGWKPGEEPAQGRILP